jgi:hypothetical protein
MLGQRRNKRPSTELLDVPEGDRENILMLKGPAGGKVDSLAGHLELAAAMPYVQGLIGEIEEDHPELTLYKELRSMSQIHGPAAGRLMGDAGAMVFEISAGYDMQSIKLFQMAMAVGGYRANSGNWGPTLNDQQRVFLPFNLESYVRGQLNFTILPRPLVPLTEMEQLELESKRIANEQAQFNLQNSRRQAELQEEAMRNGTQVLAQGGASAPTTIPAVNGGNDANRNANRNGGR